MHGIMQCFVACKDLVYFVFSCKVNLLVVSVYFEFALLQYCLLMDLSFESIALENP